MSVQDVVFSFLNGKTWKLDGVHGTFRVETIAGHDHLMHIPSERGKQSLPYRKMRAYLHDDYTTDLTDSFDIEKYGGYRFLRIAYILHWEPCCGEYTGEKVPCIDHCRCHL